MHFPGGDAQLIHVLADYLAAGWASGGVGVIIATAEHRALLHRLLETWGLSAAASQGRLIQLDARQCLSLFMRGGIPDRVLFDQTVGSLVRQHATEQPLRAYGEMVDVLWAEGNPRAALQLEALWQELQGHVPFRLLCSYTESHLDADGRDAVGRVQDYISS